MQQSSTIPSLHLAFWGSRKIITPPRSASLHVSTVLGMVSSLHPTSDILHWCAYSLLLSWVYSLKRLYTLYTYMDIKKYIYIFIVFCVGGSKAPPVLYSSYRTHNVWTGAVTSYSV